MLIFNSLYISMRTFARTGKFIMYALGPFSIPYMYVGPSHTCIDVHACTVSTAVNILHVASFVALSIITES